MDDRERIFGASRNEPSGPQPPRLPGFTPFVIVAALLVVIWAVLAFVLPAPEHITPASAVLRQSVQG
ncbi:hypothetical protein GOB93_18910 [Acetobacter musti]|uniref:Uncharacterized protein n=1 Tax=Acetobacter musti TaxID=864732 RepID=A0ABX0JV32_9PROT|nr:hypothetical protein [Acetobacter musti]NHN86682.1 hypothetical protein [Acetobacter musti]